MDDCFAGAVGVAAVFQVPALPLGIVLEARVVIAFVEILEDRREDFGVFVGKVDAFVGAREELITAGGLEIGRVAKDIFVSCKETLLVSDRERDDCTDGTARQ